MDSITMDWAEIFQKYTNSANKRFGGTKKRSTIESAPLLICIVG